MPRIGTFEGLRGLLAIWVVLGHTSKSVVLNVPEPLPKSLAGHTAVDVFIVLSGFVITLLLLEKRESFATYLTRRFMRLYPVYVVCLLASAAMLGLAEHALSTAPETPATHRRVLALQDSGDNLAVHLLLHLSMLHGLFGSWVNHAAYAILGQAWSLSVEWQFYLLAPAIMAALFGRSPWAALFCLVTLAFLAVVGGPASMGVVSSHAGHFGVGIAHCALWRMLRREPARWSPNHVRMFSLSMYVIAVVALGDWVGLTTWSVASHVACMGALEQRTPPLETRAFGFLASRPMQALGRLSYSIYLSHMLVLYPSLLLLTHLRAQPWAQALGLTAMVLGGTLFLSAGLYRVVERPFIELGARLAARRV